MKKTSDEAITGLVFLPSLKFCTASQNLRLALMTVRFRSLLTG